MKMEEAIEGFCQIYVINNNIEVCVTELKQRGFDQADVINALIVVLGYNIVEADLIVRKSSRLNA